MLTPLQQLQNQVASLQAQLANVQSAVAASGSGSASGNSYPTSLIIPFSYMTTVTVAASASAPAVIQMASDSVFELMRFLCITSADVPTNYFNNNFTCLITDQSTGRQLASTAIPQACLVTDSYQFGNDEKYPIMFPAQGIVNFVFNNLTQATLTINLVMKGYKIFQTSAKG
jgi:hypothetical protein